MGEAIVLYRGRGSSVDPELLKPTTITSNGTYTAPVTGTYRVSCVGGGGGGGGGCRNSWNSSQVFYGAGGTRGTLNTMNVTLNAGDKIQVNLGSGGAGGTNNTTVVSNNSRGTNGTTGGTTTFGSYVSGTGGSYGAWSWSRHVWSNIQQWNNKGYSGFVLIHWQCYVALGGVANKHGDDSIYIGSAYVLDSYIYYRNYWWGNAHCARCGKKTTYPSGTDGPWIEWDSPVTIPTELWKRYDSLDWKFWSIGGNNGCKFNNYANGERYLEKLGNWCSASNINMASLGGWNNTLKWNNKVTNTTTRCYTSIQQGSWWYTSSNSVTTSGTRAYRGDGGASGRAGNAGFVLIIPPQSA